MAVKRYTIRKGELTELEPVEFAFDFEDDGKTRSEHFECIVLAPGAVLFEGADAVTTGTGLVRLLTFIETVLKDSEIERFRKVVHDKNTVIPAQTIYDIANDLLTEYGSRPTGPSSAS